MNMVNWKSKLLVGVALLLVSCGTKRYEEPEFCEDLPTVFFNELNSQNWSVEQRRAVSLFESIGGDWRVTLDCPGTTDTDARLEITEVFSSNVEFYEDAEEADCNYLGKAIFQAKVTESEDVDLDGTAFILTADLRMPGSRDGLVLEASSPETPSQYSDTASFSLHVYVDENGEKTAAKQVTSTPEVSGTNGTISVTQRPACTLTDWVAQ
jgi:hypothetical protein